MKIKYSSLLPIFLFLLLVFTIGRAQISPSQSPPTWEKVDSFLCYYGKNKIKNLSQFDVAILAPNHYSANEITFLNTHSITLGYLSLGETYQLLEGDGQGPEGKAGWYFDRDGDGKVDQNPNWKSYFVDVRKKSWHRYIFKKARGILRQKGFQGLFLDTVSTADRFPQTREAMVDLIKTLSEKFPHSYLVLNYSYQIYPQVANIVDGVMLESVFSTYNKDKKTYRRRQIDDLKGYGKKIKSRLLKDRKKKKPFVIFVLDYASPDDEKTRDYCYQQARKLGFVPYVGTVHLDRILSPPREESR